MDRGWYQQSLMPPEVIEVNVRIGVIPSTDHVQAVVEIKDPLTGVLIGAWASPHRPLRQMGAVVEWALTQARDALHEAVEPF